jgi:hypothetical protein
MNVLLLLLCLYLDYLILIKNYRSTKAHDFCTQNYKHKLFHWIRLGKKQKKERNRDSNTLMKELKLKGVRAHAYQAKQKSTISIFSISSLSSRIWGYLFWTFPAFPSHSTTRNIRYRTQGNFGIWRFRVKVHFIILQSIVSNNSLI